MLPIVFFEENEVSMLGTLYLAIGEDSAFPTVRIALYMEGDFLTSPLAAPSYRPNRSNYSGQTSD